MKAIMKLALAAVAVLAMSSCGNDKTNKFDVKEFAERRTERIDQIVDLTDAQEKEIKAIFLEEGKVIKKQIKEMKKQGCDMKRPDGKKADCKKAECDKAECKKAECKDGKCDKAECKKADCKKAECDKANCTKGECKDGKCDKAECKKADCKKADCKKAECDKANCTKAECKDAKCNKKIAHRKFHFRPNPAGKKVLYEKISKVLTPEQTAKLKEHHAQRCMQAPKAQECCPSENCQK